MSRLCVSAGHGLGSRTPSQVDSGALGNGQTEATLTRELALNLAKDAAACQVYTLFRDTGYYSKADDDAVAFDATDFMEIHFDAGTAKAHGVGVLVGPNATASEMAWAKGTAEAIAHRLGITNRGVKVRDDLAVLHQHKMNSILVEVCFITNDGDMTKYLKNKKGVELAIFNAYRKHIGRKAMTFIPRLTWRSVRISKYLKRK